MDFCSHSLRLIQSIKMLFNPLCCSHGGQPLQCNPRFWFKIIENYKKWPEKRFFKTVCFECLAFISKYARGRKSKNSIWGAMEKLRVNCIFGCIVCENWINEFLRGCSRAVLCVLQINHSFDKLMHNKMIYFKRKLPTALHTHYTHIRFERKRERE